MKFNLCCLLLLSLAVCSHARHISAKNWWQYLDGKGRQDIPSPSLESATPYEGTNQSDSNQTDKNVDINVFLPKKKPDGLGPIEPLMMSRPLQQAPPALPPAVPAAFPQAQPQGFVEPPGYSFPNVVRSFPDYGNTGGAAMPMINELSRALERQQMSQEMSHMSQAISHTMVDALLLAGRHNDHGDHHDHHDIHDIFHHDDHYYHHDHHDHHDHHYHDHHYHDHDDDHDHGLSMHDVEYAIEHLHHHDGGVTEAIKEAFKSVLKESNFRKPTTSPTQVVVQAIPDMQPTTVVEAPTQPPAVVEPPPTPQPVIAAPPPPTPPPPIIAAPPPPPPPVIAAPPPPPPPQVIAAPPPPPPVIAAPPPPPPPPVVAAPPPPPPVAAAPPPPPPVAAAPPPPQPVAAAPPPPIAAAAPPPIAAAAPPPVAAAAAATPAVAPPAIAAPPAALPPALTAAAPAAGLAGVPPAALPPAGIAPGAGALAPGGAGLSPGAASPALGAAGPPPGAGSPPMGQHLLGASHDNHGAAVPSAAPSAAPGAAAPSAAPGAAAPGAGAPGAGAPGAGAPGAGAPGAGAPGAGAPGAGAPGAGAPGAAAPGGTPAGGAATSSSTSEGKESVSSAIRDFSPNNPLDKKGYTILGDILAKAMLKAERKLENGVSEKELLKGNRKGLTRKHAKSSDSEEDIHIKNGLTEEIVEPHSKPNDLDDSVDKSTEESDAEVVQENAGQVKEHPSEDRAAENIKRKNERTAEIIGLHSTPNNDDNENIDRSSNDIDNEELIVADGNHVKEHQENSKSEEGRNNLSKHRYAKARDPDKDSKIDNQLFTEDSREKSKKRHRSHGGLNSLFKYRQLKRKKRKKTVAADTPELSNFSF